MSPGRSTIKTAAYDSFSFTGDNKADEQYMKAQKYANKMKFLNFFIPISIEKYNLEKLEGIQNGIKIFEGLNMKEITYLFNNLNAVAVKRGCSNQCLHCYAGAMPSGKEHNNHINKMPYETFTELTSGIKELRKRLGINLSSHNTGLYTNLYYDADCMEIVLFDKNGKEHDFIELMDKYYEVSNNKSIFDTSGWNHKNPKMQARAEKYVKYLLDLENQEKFYQINLSMSPFHSIYAKALELGYNPENYSTQKESSDNKNKGEKLYKTYIDRMANMLYTFTPMVDEPNFSIISRPADNSEKNMKNFTKADYQLIKKHVLDALSQRYYTDLKTERKYIHHKSQIQHLLMQYSKLMSDYDTDLIYSGRYKELYLKRNPDLSEADIENRFKNILLSKQNLDNLQKEQNLNSSEVNYLKIIDTNGKLYLFDDYRLIPTEIGLNLSTKDKITPELCPKPEDFTITREMINKCI